MDLYLAVRPEDTQAASACRAGLAHAAYRIGADSALLSRNLLLQTRGGLLVLSDREAPPVRAPASLAEALLRECARRDYRGMVLDFAAPHRGDLGQLAAELSRRCTAGRRQLLCAGALRRRRRAADGHCQHRRLRRQL